MQNTFRHGNIQIFMKRNFTNASLPASQLTTCDLNLETFKYLPITQHITFGYAMNVTGKYLYNANNFITQKCYLTSSFYKNTRMCKLHKVLQLEVKYRGNTPNNQGNKPSGETHPPNSGETDPPGKQTLQGNTPTKRLGNRPAREPYPQSRCRDKNPNHPFPYEYTTCIYQLWCNVLTEQGQWLGTS